MAYFILEHGVVQTLKQYPRIITITKYSDKVELTGKANLCYDIDLNRLCQGLLTSHVSQLCVWSDMTAICRSLKRDQALS